MFYAAPGRAKKERHLKVIRYWIPLYAVVEPYRDGVTTYSELTRSESNAGDFE